MKIVFWGTPTYAAENLINIVNAGYNVIAVITQPDRKRNRGNKLSPSPVKEAANQLGIPAYTTPSISKDQITKGILIDLNADAYVVVAFGQILPREILDQPCLGCWNSHASLLPQWRGAAPIHWSIINDDKMTGICIMSMEEGLDTGPVIEQEVTPISDSDNLEILSKKLSNISSKLLIKSLANINMTRGLNKNDRLKRLKAIDQSILEGNVSYARQIKKEDYLIDWNNKARIILKRVLGLYPNAYTSFNGKRIKILEICESKNIDLSLYIKEDYDYLNKNKPGEVIFVDKIEGIIIMTADNPLIIRKGQLEGKKTTDGYTLSYQSKIKKNNILGN